jgi:putative glutamine amidotransferase
MKPLVLVTTGLDMHSGSHRRPSVYLYTSYIEALQAAGLAPVLVTPAHTSTAIDSLLDACCGVVLTGGDDVDPVHYGEAPHPSLQGVQPARDEMEFRVLDGALHADMPILAICRGLQLVNVAFGGTLYQDIPSQRPDSLGHSQSSGWARRTHRAHVEAGTRLFDIVRSTEIHINSFHHQAIRDLGSGLVMTARAEDGLIEAIEAPDRRWLVGVQWHPERQEADAPYTDPDIQLFAAFAGEAGRLAGERAPSGVARG